MGAVALPLHPDFARSDADASSRTAPPVPMPARTPVGRIIFDEYWCVKRANQDACMLLQARCLVGLSLQEFVRQHAIGLGEDVFARPLPLSLCRPLKIGDRAQPCVINLRREERDVVLRFEVAGEVAFLDHLRDAAGVVDDRGQLVYVNEHFGQQFATSPEGVVGRPAVEVLNRFYASPSFTHHLLQAVLSGQPWAETPQLLLADGRRHVLSVRLIPWRYAGCVCGIVWLASDVTDIADSAQQRTAAVMYRVMATLQHEMRNPLQTMQAAVDVLRGEVTASGQRFLDILAEHIQIINGELSDQMLFGAQSQTAFFPGRLSDVVRREVERASLRARTAELTFLHDQPGREPAIRLHRGSMGRVFANLFRNAAQARANATVEVRYRVDGRHIICSVEDNGPGFDDRACGAEGTWLGHDDEPGAHLGLAIVASTVEAHGGTVTIGNRPTGGARILLRLPVAEGAEAVVREGADHPEAGGVAEHGGRAVVAGGRTRVGRHG